MRINKTTIFFLIISLASCYKDAKLNNDDKFILLGGMISGLAPDIKLYQTNVKSIGYLPYPEYELIISDEDGASETMKDGKFTLIKAR